MEIVRWAHFCLVPETELADEGVGLFPDAKDFTIQHYSYEIRGNVSFCQMFGWNFIHAHSVMGFVDHPWQLSGHGYFNE